MTTRLAVCAALAATLSTHAYAGGSGLVFPVAVGSIALVAASSDKVQSVHTYWENDLFSLTDKSDRWYTNGIKVTAMFKPDKNASPSVLSETVGGRCRASFFGKINLGDPEACKVYAGMSIGQNIYTPRDRSSPNPQPNDRPWAGFLYASLIYQAQSERDSIYVAGERRKTLETWELKLGVIGPPSGAQWVQTEFHRLTKSTLPQGWHHQLRSEPAFLVSYTAERQFLIGDKNQKALRTDLLGYFNANGGTVKNDVAVGLIVRGGWNYSSLPGAGAEGENTPSAFAKQEPGFGAYAFAKYELRAVATNAFLDGGFFRNGPSVRKERLVDTLSIGANAHIWRGWSVSYVWNQRRADFKSADTRYHRFAALSVSWTRPL
jgi:lipid A 3-O-deacylase